MTNSGTKFLMYAVPLGIALFIGIYLYGSNSEALRFGEEAIKHSREIELRVGTVQRVRLDPFGGYREKAFNADRSVHMTVVVTGSKGQITAAMFVKKTNDVWKVEETLVDGKAISLR